MCAGLKGRKRKKPGRLAPHIMEDYVELDDGVETETPVARRLGGPGRRPSLGLRPTSGLTERQCAAAPTRLILERCVPFRLHDRCFWQVSITMGVVLGLPADTCWGMGVPEHAYSRVDPVKQGPSQELVQLGFIPCEGLGGPWNFAHVTGGSGVGVRERDGSVGLRGC